MNTIRIISLFCAQLIILISGRIQKADSLSLNPRVPTITLSSAHNFPITRDTLNKFPDSVEIEAILADYTLGTSCGILCGCGSLKMRVTKKNELYREEFIYVGMPCFNSKEMVKEFEKSKKLKLYKISMNDKRCYWTEVPMNKFDTKGLPFYTFWRLHSNNR